MGLTGLISVHISLNVIVMYTWNNAGILPNQDLKSLLYLFKIYSECKVNRLSWLFSYEFFWNVCWYAISVYLLCCNEHKLMKLSMKSGFYLSSSTSAWTTETIKSIVKLKSSIHKYPTTPVWYKYHLWMPILKRHGIGIQVLGCNMHFRDIVCV